MIELHGWTYAEPEPVASPDDCTFYHAMDLPWQGRTLQQPGTWNLTGRWGDYLGGIDVRGRSLLDVGTATGWISFEAEQHGASEVVSLDAAHHAPAHTVPYRDLGLRARTERVATNNQAAATDAVAASDRMVEARLRLRRSYWLSHRLLGSKAKVVYGDVFKVGDHISGADIVVIGQLLVHLRDPLEALHQCARAAKDTLVVIEGSFESDRPLMVFCGGGGNYYSWFHLSTTMYKEYLGILGFEVTSVACNSYPCSHADVTPMVEVWTFVARRVRPTLGMRTD